MKKSLIAFFILIFIISCDKSNERKVKVFTLFSKAFRDLKKSIEISEKHNDLITFGSSKFSIPLYWKKAPEKTVSYAILMTDMHPVADNFIHWFVTNIPSKTVEIKENSSIIKMPTNAIEYDNSFGYKGYGGPAPFEGTGRHEYNITIYALDTEYIDGIDANESGYLDYVKLTGILDSHTVEKASLTGYSER